MPEPNDLIPWERVEQAFRTNLDVLYEFVVSCVLAADFDRATFYSRRIQRMEVTQENIRIIYNQRAMTLAELNDYAKLMQDDSELEPFNGPRPTAWARILATGSV